MRTLVGRLQAAGANLRDLIHELPLQRRTYQRAGGDRRHSQTSPMEAYTRAVFQSLAVFRFFSYAMGVAVVFALAAGDQPPISLIVVLMLAGVFNVYRVTVPLRPETSRDVTRWAILGADVVLNVALILVSGGLDSGFLIYSLSPILTASLLTDLRHAGVVAGVSALSVVGAHLAPGLGFTDFPWILSRNYLVFALLHSAVCLLIAYLPFVANLNWQRRIRADSLASERQRLRSEVHDNVAQTLAFLSLKMKRAEQRASQAQSVLTARDAAEIRSVVERAYLSVRDYLDGTGDGDSDEPLEVRLAAVVGQWRRDTGMAATVTVEGEERELPSRVKHQLVQVAREALANAAKHAYPENVWVELRCTPTEVILRVRDDGRGFSPSGVHGHGMDIMNERSALVGASVTINSAPGEGTEVVVAYPRGARQAAS